MGLAFGMVSAILASFADSFQIGLGSSIYCAYVSGALGT